MLQLHEQGKINGGNLDRHNISLSLPITALKELRFPVIPHIQLRDLGTKNYGKNYF